MSTLEIILVFLLFGLNGISSLDCYECKFDVGDDSTGNTVNTPGCGENFTLSGNSMFIQTNCKSCAKEVNEYKDKTVVTRLCSNETKKEEVCSYRQTGSGNNYKKTSSCFCLSDLCNAVGLPKPSSIFATLGYIYISYVMRCYT